MRGNPDHPYTRGALCVKVNRYLEHVRSPDRILYPLRRVGRKGEGRFERIGWDEALTEISTRLRAIIDEYGGEAIWPYQGTGTLGYLQGEGGVAGRRLWNVLGASRHDVNICTRSGGIGMTLTVGTPAGLDGESFALAKLILLWGANTLTSGHHQWKFVQRAKRNGAHVVVIDPIRTRTADQADEHLPIRPGTDGALALGLMYMVLEEGCEDREFLDRHTVGWAEFEPEIRKYPPARVAEITGLPEETIRALGVRIAHTRPTAIQAMMGVQRHAGGGAALRLMACIPGVTGDWLLPGGGVAYSTADHVPFVPDTRDDLLPHPVRTLYMTRLADGLGVPGGHDAEPVPGPPVKCLWVYGANPMASVSDQNRIRQGLLRDDLFTVVMEQVHTDTVDYADIVLPATTQIEHTDLNSGYGHLYLQWNEPAVEPPGECLSTTETFRRLAAHMGLTEPSLYDSDLELAEQLLASDHPALTGITLERLRKEGWVRLSLPEPFTPFAHGFPTPSGKLEFVSDRAEQMGLGRVPHYVPSRTADRARRRSEAYPLALITPASHMFLNSTFGANPELRRRAKGPRVLINAADAAERGITDGCRVRVFNGNGEIIADAEVTDRVRPGVVASAKGHWPKLSPGGTAVNALVDERDSDMGRGGVFHDNTVQVEACR